MPVSSKAFAQFACVLAVAQADKSDDNNLLQNRMVKLQAKTMGNLGMTCFAPEECKCKGFAHDTETGECTRFLQEPQWRFRHGYWQSDCVDLDAKGDVVQVFTTFRIIDSFGDRYTERSLVDSAWTLEMTGQPTVNMTKTSVEGNSSVGTKFQSVLAGEENSLMTFFHDAKGSLVASRLASFRATNDIMRAIVSTQKFTDGAPDGLEQCNEFKFSNFQAAKDAIADATSDPLPFVAPAPVLAETPAKRMECDAASIVLSDYGQWEKETGYWLGDLTYFDSTFKALLSQDWNYPYDHYQGFIVGDVKGPSYSQRNIFLYPPQSEAQCQLNNQTYVSEELCGETGAAKRFQADQTTQYCDELQPGRISGPHGGLQGDEALSTVTTLVGEDAVLYQIWQDTESGERVLWQSQMTTITQDRNTIRRTRTAQFFDTEAGHATTFSYYREQKTTSELFLAKLDSTIASYAVTDAALSQVCPGGLVNAKSFLLGALDWDGDKYRCPTPDPSGGDNTTDGVYAVWMEAGVKGWAAYFPDDPMTPGAYLTASKLAQIPGATVASLEGYGWVDVLATPRAIWTEAGVKGWAAYFPEDPMIPDAYLAASKLAQIPGATVASLEGYGWVDLFATPRSVWTEVGVKGWAAYFPDDPIMPGAYLTASKLAQMPKATIASLKGDGWVDFIALA